MLCMSVTSDTFHVEMCPCAALAAASSETHCETASALLASVIGGHTSVHAYPADAQLVLEEKLAWMLCLRHAPRARAALNISAKVATDDTSQALTSRSKAKALENK